MKYKNLKFLEITETALQATVNLDMNYKIQIIHNTKDNFDDCNLYDPTGSIIDCVSGEDEAGVNFFIEQSIRLIDDIKFFEEASNENLEFLDKEQFEVIKH